MTLSTLLKQFRRRAKLSQSEAAARLGVPVRTLQEWEHGRYTPDALKIEALKARMESHD